MVGNTNPGLSRSIALAVSILSACGGRTTLDQARSQVSPAGTSTHPGWTSPNADGSCPLDTTSCGLGSGAKCYALDRDANNCGRCDNRCVLGISCAAGLCRQHVCSGALTLGSAPSSAVDSPPWPRYGSADMNGDGKVDLVVWSDSGTVDILLGNGDGTFSPGPSYPAWTSSQGYVTDSFVVVGDFNEDGIPDLAVSVPGRNDSVDVWLGNGDGGLALRQPHPGQPLTNLYLGDVNRDGHLDLVLSNSDAKSVIVLLGNGDGNFAKSGPFSTGEGVVQVLIRDWDGDGIYDLLAMGSHLHVLLGLSKGGFAKQMDCGIGVDLRRTVIDDFNSDGKQDLATVQDPKNAISVTLGRGTCSFSTVTDYATPSSPSALAGGDVTGDGIVDLVVAYGDSQRSYTVTYVGRGDGMFERGASVNSDGVVADVILGDYNGDGRVDVLVGDGQGGHVELNTCQ